MIFSISVFRWGRELITLRSSENSMVHFYGSMRHILMLAKNAVERETPVPKLLVWEEKNGKFLSRPVLCCRKIQIKK